MRRRRTGLYHALVVLPDRLFPLRTQVQGQWVRGIRSYNARLASIQRRYGAGHFGYMLNAYRQLFHLFSGILLLTLATVLLQNLLGSTVALYVFLAGGILFITFQEFYLQRRLYNQLWRKGLLDWVAWCLPVGIYLFIHFH